MSKMLAHLHALKLLVTLSCEDKTRVATGVDIELRMVAPKMAHSSVPTKYRPVDYGHCNMLMIEKYGPVRGQKMYDGMVDFASSGAFFHAGTKIIAEKMAMMAVLKKTGMPDDHHYQGLYALWLARK